jgi:hypothetical protein
MPFNVVQTTSGSVKKKNCKFQADWMKDFQFLRPSSLGNESSFCTLCSVNFSDVGAFWGEMYKSNMKTTRQSFQMIAHCLFTSIDSNEKS